MGNCNGDSDDKEDDAKKHSDVVLKPADNIQTYGTSICKHMERSTKICNILRKRTSNYVES